jgi:hypothetical protein
MGRETLLIPPAPGSRFIADPWEIFDPLRPEAEELTWVLWGETWLTAKPDSDLNVLELEERVQSMPRGVVMDWPAMSELLSNLNQVIDGTFIGCRDPDAVPTYPGTGLDKVHRNQDLVVTADDSSFWWVSGETSVTAPLRHAFPHAEQRRGFE